MVELFFKVCQLRFTDSSFLFQSSLVPVCSRLYLVHNFRLGKNLFHSIYTNYIAKDIPIYMGEFGCSMRNKSDASAWAFYKYYLEYVVKAARSFGIAPFLWDNGAKGYGKERHAYIDHGTGNYVGNSQEVVAVMKKAWNSTGAGYSLQSVYDSAPTK